MRERISNYLLVAWNFDEALVQREVVSDAVLPALFILPVVREALHDETVDAVERDLLRRFRVNRHCNERNVAVWRLNLE